MTDERVLLIIEGDDLITRIAARLRGEGLSVLVATAETALAALRDYAPQLVVLDQDLAGTDASELAGQIRAIAAAPILALTRSDEPADPVAALQASADGYLSKPVDDDELTDHIRQALRLSRRSDPAGDVLRFGDVTIDRRTSTVTASAGPIPFTNREFDLVNFLASHPGQIFSRDELLENVWDRNAATHASAVTVHIRRIRTKLEANPSRPRYIKTIWGVGYKFDP